MFIYVGKPGLLNSLGLIKVFNIFPLKALEVYSLESRAFLFMHLPIKGIPYYPKVTTKSVHNYHIAVQTPVFKIKLKLSTKLPRNKRSHILYKSSRLRST